MVSDQIYNSCVFDLDKNTNETKRGFTSHKIVK